MDNKIVNHNSLGSLTDSSFAEREQVGASLREMAMNAVARYEKLDEAAQPVVSEAIKIKLGTVGFTVNALT